MKFKRVAALIAALLFIALSVAILVLAVTGAPANYLMAALLCLVLVPVFLLPVEEVEELSQTQRGEGGFGSTGR